MRSIVMPGGVFTGFSRQRGRNSGPPGKEIPRDPGDLIRRKYPDYQLNVVTEVTDGEKIIYPVRMAADASIKMLSVCDGEIRVIGEQAIDKPATVAVLSFSPQSYP
jgi:hypothetical protein